MFFVKCFHLGISPTIIFREEKMELKTKKNTDTCTDRLFPVKCPHGKTHRLDDGVFRPTYVGDVFCRTNLCGKFAGISSDEEVVYCNGNNRFD
jgi:hypothetical protein